MHRKVGYLKSSLSLIGTEFYEWSAVLILWNCVAALNID
jgi:hypothetical protein